MNTVNSLAKTYFQERIKAVRKAAEHPHESQEQVFHYLRKKALKTVRGQFYGIEQITNYTRFQECIPLSNYESQHQFLERVYQGEAHLLRPGKVSLFAKSSGTTTGASKILPLTNALLTKNHYAGGQDMLALYTSLFPLTRVFTGKLFALGGAYEKHTFRKKCYEGDLSGLLVRKAPKRIQQMRYPPPRFSRMYDRDKKLEQLSRLSPKYNITCLAGIPSRIKLLLENIENMHNTPIREIRPHLEVFFHGGIALGSYERDLKRILPEETFFCEVYNASEGYFAVQDQQDSRELLLLTNRGIFYEFKNLQTGNICPLSQVTPGVDYSLVISTPGGLRRYEIGDIIMFTSTRPYRIKVVGRTKLYLNKYGEHVSVENIEQVVKKIGESHSMIFHECTVGYDGTAHHRCIETPNHENLDEDKLAEQIDKLLQSVNDDYQIMRRNDCMLLQPTVTLLPYGTVHERMRQRNKLGGQHKFPRVCPSSEMLTDILQLAQR